SGSETLRNRPGFALFLPDFLGNLATLIKRTPVWGASHPYESKDTSERLGGSGRFCRDAGLGAGWRHRLQYRRRCSGDDHRRLSAGVGSGGGGRPSSPYFPSSTSESWWNKSTVASISSRLIDTLSTLMPKGICPT